MRSILSALFLTLFSLTAAFGQSTRFWSEIPADQIRDAKGEARIILPEHFRTYHLDFEGIKNYLLAAPAEATTAAKNSPLVLELPLPDGSLEFFEVFEVQDMEPGLAAKFPFLKSYAGRSRSDRTSLCRINVGEDGFHVVYNLNDRGGFAYLDPFQHFQTDYYFCFFAKDFKISKQVLEDMKVNLSCATDMEAVLEKNFGKGHYHGDLLEKNADSEIELRDPYPNQNIPLVTYRLALACTGEFAVLKAGGSTPTMAGTMSVLTTALNKLNFMLETQIAVRLLMVATNDKVVFIDPITDPYENATSGGALLGQNVDVCNSKIGVVNYDVGHCFTSGCIDVGGVVSGLVCSTEKAAGITCHYSNDLEYIVTTVWAHEGGHQYTAGHSWNRCGPNGFPGQYHGSSATEPGSASTIMSYAGSCGADNIQGGSDEYFVAKSLEEFIGFTRASDFGDCRTTTNTGNHAPVAKSEVPQDLFIPISTPFKLVGSATDQDGDGLTFGWDQNDLGPQCELGIPTGNAPAFRSWIPTAKPFRLFPRWETLIVNGTNKAEVLPTYSRDFVFRFVARDNHPGGGFVDWVNVHFESTASAGPFKITYPNTTGIVWRSGAYEKVEWDVANTNLPPVNCQKVHILGYLKGLTNPPDTLVKNTDNDGFEYLLIPNVTANICRIWVEAADNIFLDISDKNFKISAPTEPAFSAAIGTAWQKLCMPQTGSAELKTVALLGFDKPITFTVTNGLPAGATATFSANPVMPGESCTVSLNFDNEPEGEYTIEIQASADGSTPVILNTTVKVISNNFDGLVLQGPADGAIGVLPAPVFNWTPVADADSYDIEIAGTPTFNPLFKFASNLTNTNYSLTTLLAPNTTYYWRVRPVNECGQHAWRDAYSFHTESIECSVFESTQNNLPISASGTPTVESNLNILTNGLLSDVNVREVTGFHEFFKDLDIKLVSPQGTEVQLVKSKCGNFNGTFKLTFDDEAVASTAVCPPTNNKVVKPESPLSALDGQTTAGQWKLRIKDQVGTSGGSFSKWKLEFCSKILVDTFSLLNFPLSILPGNNADILPDLLKAEHPNKGPELLTFTIVTLVKHGQLQLNGNPLVEGSTFTQADINNGKLRYFHFGSDNSDYFRFIITDGGGGYLGTPKFDIDVIVGTGDPADFNRVLLFPNPANDLLNLQIIGADNAIRSVSVFNLQGQAVDFQGFNFPKSNCSVATGHFSSGIYLVRVETLKGVLVEKLVISR